MKAQLYEEILSLFALTRELEEGHPLVLNVKLAEEFGEFSESVLHHLGYLQHKEVKEDPIHEAADMINVIIGCLTQLYPDKSPYDLVEDLHVAISEKGDKYERILRNQQ